MDKNKIQLNYSNKIKLFKKLNKFYYEKSQPMVDDRDYDKLKKDILELENKYEYLNSDFSPSKSIGYKPSKNFKKILHKVPMLSLSNAFTKDDLINFEKKIINFLSKKNNFKLNYSAEPKIDGISASLTYKDGKMQPKATKSTWLYSATQT